MKKKLLAMFLTVVMAAGLAACSGGATAATMHLRRTEGTVAVSDGSGKDVPLLDNLSLYSGYGVGTRSASYAWIDLDDVKLTKLDQNSEISIQKEGKALNIEVISGSLFFNVTQPLEDDETMEIRASTMLVGIRGTCGWVENRNSISRVYLLEGKVECSAGTRTVQVSAGEMAELTVDGELVVKEFTQQDIPAFVRDDADPDLIGGVEGTPEPTPTPTPTPPTDEEAQSYISLAIDGDAYYAEEPITLEDLDGPRTISGYNVLSQETQLTVSNLAGAADNCYIRIDLMLFTKETDSSGYMYPGSFYLTDEGEFKREFMYDNNDLKLRPGESVTFRLLSRDDYPDYPINVLVVTLVYPDYEKEWWGKWQFLMDSAAERPTDETAWSYISVTTDGDAYYVEEPIMLNAPGPFEPWSLDHYTVVSQETQLTVSNRANAENDCYIQILIDEFYSRSSYDGQEYYQAWPMPTNYLTNEGVFDFMMPDDNILKLRPGESVKFTLEDQEDLVHLRTRLYYPEYDYSWWSNWYILVDDEAAARLRQEQT